MRVGALTQSVVAPHFYGFTWSPIGVATEYVKPTYVVRDHQKMERPALSERATLIVDGLTLEEDFHLRRCGGPLRGPGPYGAQPGLQDLALPRSFRLGGRRARRSCPRERRRARLSTRSCSRQIPLMYDDVVIIHAYAEGDGQQRIPSSTGAFLPYRARSPRSPAPHRHSVHHGGGHGGVRLPALDRRPQRAPCSKARSTPRPSCPVPSSPVSTAPSPRPRACSGVSRLHPLSRLLSQLEEERLGEAMHGFAQEVLSDLP